MHVIWWRFIRHFSSHVFVATVIFLIFGGVAACLSVLVQYLDSVAYVSHFTIEVLTFVEGATLVADSLLYLGYVVVTVWTTFKELMK